MQRLTIAIQGHPVRVNYQICIKNTACLNSCHSLNKMNHLLLIVERQLLLRSQPCIMANDLDVVVGCIIRTPTANDFFWRAEGMVHDVGANDAERSTEAVLDGRECFELPLIKTEYFTLKFVGRLADVKRVVVAYSSRLRILCHDSKMYNRCRRCLLSIAGTEQSPSPRQRLSHDPGKGRGR